MLPDLLPTRIPRFGLSFSGLLVALVTMTAGSTDAQQFVVDDAGITDPGACQVEGWVGESAGWLLSACTPIGRVELTLGVGYLDEPEGTETNRQVEYVVQAKVALLPDDPGMVGLSVVGGFGFDPFAQVTGVPLESVFAYLPLTYTLADRWAEFHVNGGWAYQHEVGDHDPIYGIRGDAVLHEGVTLIGEFFGEGSEQGVQGGLRVAVIPDLLLVDGSYGAFVSGDRPDIGFALGIAITPQAFLAHIR